MSDREMLTTLDGTLLAAAFPTGDRSATMPAAFDVAERLAPRQWTERFSVKVAGEIVLIPTRLHFASDQSLMSNKDEAWPYARALQTRSSDGFQRQIAVRDLLGDMKPWAAPFVVALMGEYIVEILDDIAAALTPDIKTTLGIFIADNEAYWATTKRRVTSYWNAYYRPGWGDRRRAYRREEYVGFTLIAKLERSGFGRALAVG